MTRRLGHYRQGQGHYRQPSGDYRGEELAGQLLRQAREARGWSQQEVANRMSDYGYSWRQSTIHKIETAQRPLRVNELADLATLFEPLEIGNFLIPGGVPHDYPDYGVVPDKKLSVEEIGKLLSYLKQVSEDGDNRLRERAFALDGAARAHRFAEMDYKVAAEEIKKIHSRIVELQGLREELLAQAKDESHD